MTWHIEIDQNNCIASGMCAALSPEHFELGDATSHPVNPDVEPDEIVLEAADSCPTAAITVTEGGKVIAPEL
jgi:ferredoxin